MKNDDAVFFEYISPERCGSNSKRPRVRLTCYSSRFYNTWRLAFVLMKCALKLGLFGSFGLTLYPTHTRFTTGLSGPTNRRDF